MPGLAEGATKVKTGSPSNIRIYEDQHYQLIGKIYEAASAPELWMGVLADLTANLESTKSVFVCHDCFDYTGRVWEAHGVSSQYRDLYSAGLGAKNPWVSKAADARQIGEVAPGDAIIDREDIHKSGFYRQFLQPQGLDYTLHASIATFGRRVLHLIVGRPEAMGPYSNDDVEICQRLVGHIRRAWQIKRANAKQDFVEEGTLEALNMLTVGVAMIAGDGKVLAMNEAAQSIVKCGDGLQISQTGLEATESRIPVTSSGLADQAKVTKTEQSASDSVKVVSVPRPSGRRPYLLLVRPFRSASDPFDDVQTAALVFISDPEAATGDYGSELLRHIYRLTPAEARVATLVAGGNRILDIAEQLKISVHTARTHLKRIFGKTGVERQAELVQLLYGSLSLLRLEKANGLDDLPPCDKNLDFPLPQACSRLTITRQSRSDVRP